MTNKLYTSTLLIFIIVFLLIIFMNTFVDTIDWSMQQTVKTITFFAIPVVSLMLLYFGIYANIRKVKTVRKLFRPIMCIIVASILTLFLFGSLTLKYFSLSGLASKKYSHYSEVELQKLKESCLDKTLTSNRAAAAKYYIETGQSVEFLDEHGQKTLFSPDAFHKKAFQQRKFIERTILWYKKSLIILLVYAVVSLAVFLLFLRVKTGRALAG
ncbi:hypothetical protein KA005_04060 [bacterium]|nr:hypothetical protein [bacterium]